MLRAASERALSFGLVHMSGEDRDDRAGNLILDCKDIFELSIVSFGPTVGAGRGIDELRRDADAIAGAADAAFEDVTDAKLATDLPDVRRLAFVLEARVAGDDEQLGEARQLGDDVFGDAVAEVVLAADRRSCW